MDRLNSIIAGLKRLQRDANEILDGRVRILLHTKPHGTSFGQTKMEAFKAAGTTLNYVRALEMARDGEVVTDTGR
jgi:hypothetical protein